MPETLQIKEKKSFSIKMMLGNYLEIINASSQSLSAISQHVGLASAIIYLLEMILAALALYIAGLFFNNTLWPIAIAGVVWVVLAFILYQRSRLVYQ